MRIRLIRLTRGIATLGILLLLIVAFQNCGRFAGDSSGSDRPVMSLDYSIDPFTQKISSTLGYSSGGLSDRIPIYRGVVFSPDESTLAYAKMHSGASLNQKYYGYDLNLSRPFEIYESSDHEGQRLIYTPDSKYLINMNLSLSNSDSVQVNLIDNKTHKIRRIHSEFAEIGVSPDSHYVILNETSLGLKTYRISDGTIFDVTASFPDGTAGVKGRAFFTNNNGFAVGSGSNRLVFIGANDRTLTSPTGLYSVNLDGTGLSKISQGNSFSYSTMFNNFAVCGDAVVYWTEQPNGSGFIRLVKHDGSEEAMLKENQVVSSFTLPDHERARAQFTENCGQILYAFTGDDQIERLYLYDRAAKSTAIITQVSDGQKLSQFRFSPGDQYVFFRVDEILWSYHVPSGSSTVLSLNQGEPAQITGYEIGSNLNVVYVTKNEGRVQYVNPSTGTRGIIFEPATKADVSFGSLQALYYGFRSGGYNDWRSDVHRLSPDGTRFYFIGRRPTDTDLQLFSFNLEQNTLTRMRTTLKIDGHSNIFVNAGGSRVFFTSSSEFPGEYDLYMITGNQ